MKLFKNAIALAFGLLLLSGCGSGTKGTSSSISKASTATPQPTATPVAEQAGTISTSGVTLEEAQKEVGTYVLTSDGTFHKIDDLPAYKSNHVIIFESETEGVVRLSSSDKLVVCGVSSLLKDRPRAYCAVPILEEGYTLPLFFNKSESDELYSMPGVQWPTGFGSSGIEYVSIDQGTFFDNYLTDFSEYCTSEWKDFTTGIQNSAYTFQKNHAEDLFARMDPSESLTVGNYKGTAYKEWTIAPTNYYYAGDFCPKDRLDDWDSDTEKLETGFVYSGTRIDYETTKEGYFEFNVSGLTPGRYAMMDVDNTKLAFILVVE